MNELMKKIKSASTVKEASILSESTLFNEKTSTKTSLPILNAAFSAKFSSGFKSGLTVIAGPSRSFKSLLGLFMIKAYLDSYKDSVCVYLDSEFGTPPEYVSTFGIDTSRVIHIPVKHLEQLRIEMVNLLEKVNRGEKVIFFIDSVGNLASLKEMEDAKDEKIVADFSRAKTLKSIGRLITPQLTLKDIPCIAINHTIEVIGSPSHSSVMTGGVGLMYSADQVFFISRSQDKLEKEKELLGYFFTISIEKSRYVKEKSKFTFNVKFENGIDMFSGLFDLALEFGLVTAAKQGWYIRPTVEGDKNWRRAETSCAKFWKPIFEETNFQDCVFEKYSLGASPLMKPENIDLLEDDLPADDDTSQE